METELNESTALPDATPPGADEIGHEGTWLLPTDERDSGVVGVVGRYLGMSSSQGSYHVNVEHSEDGYVVHGRKCSACRWTEIRVFRCANDEAFDSYLVHYAGETDVPGEEVRYRHEVVAGAQGLLEELLTRSGGEVKYSRPAGRVLSMAANFDTLLREAWESRRVS